jgi:hypothetical protein
MLFGMARQRCLETGFQRIYRRMNAAVHAMIARQADLLFRGDTAAMLTAFDLPLAVQHGDDMLVMATAEQFCGVMAGHRAALVATNVTGLQARMTAIELPRRGRFRVWVDLDHLRDAGIDPGADQFVLYCRQDLPDIRIELIDCIRLSTATVASQPRRRLA